MLTMGKCKLNLQALTPLLHYLEIFVKVKFRRYVIYCIQSKRRPRFGGTASFPPIWFDFCHLSSSFLCLLKLVNGSHFWHPVIVCTYISSFVATPTRSLPVSLPSSPLSINISHLRQFKYHSFPAVAYPFVTFFKFWWFIELHIFYCLALI